MVDEIVMMLLFQAFVKKKIRYTQYTTNFSGRVYIGLIKCNRSKNADPILLFNCSPLCKL